MITAGLVLAAGASTRFGVANKLLAEFRGRPLAAWAADAMRASPVDLRIAATGNTDVARLFDGFTIATVSGDRPAQSESLRAGLAAARALGADRLIVSLADMPLVTADLIAAILACPGDGGITAATDGHRAMPPAAFTAAWFDRLAGLTGDRGAGQILRDLPASALVTAGQGALTDIDTAEDLARLA